MKINTLKKELSSTQKFFSKPLSFKQRVEVKKLQIAGMICKEMEKLKLSRSKLAAKMGIKPSRVTAMLDGTQNLTIETIMRASEALDQKFECTMVPKEHVALWRSCESASHHQKIENISVMVEYSKAQFVPAPLANNDEALAS